MFYGCNSLLSFFSNFDISSVTNMEFMFYQCYKLKSLNLSSFNNKEIKIMNYMFYQCKNLEYINLYNFQDETNIKALSMFYEIPENIIYCINNEKNAPKISQQLSEKKCSINYCSDNWKSQKQN